MKYYFKGSPFDYLGEIDKETATSAISTAVYRYLRDKKYNKEYINSRMGIEINKVKNNIRFGIYKLLYKKEPTKQDFNPVPEKSPEQNPPKQGEFVFLNTPSTNYYDVEDKLSQKNKRK